MTSALIVWLHPLTDLLRAGGGWPAYAVLLVGSAIEGEVALLAFAAAAHTGELSLPAVMAVAAVGTSLASQAYYELARRRGRGWIEHRLRRNPRLLATFERSLGRAERHGSALMAGSRFLYGFRIVIPAACGLIGMKPLRFALLNLAGAAVWAVVTGLVGYSFSELAGRVLTHLKHAEWIVIVVLIAISLAVWIWHRLHPPKPPVKVD